MSLERKLSVVPVGYTRDTQLLLRALMPDTNCWHLLSCANGELPRDKPASRPSRRWTARTVAGNHCQAAPVISSINRADVSGRAGVAPRIIWATRAYAKGPLLPKDT